jgi:glyoxylase-like metal-dependent hydrolase (beta-lactamase superfamily II)
MNKILKRALVAIGIVAGVVVLAYGAMTLKLNHETRDFTPLETGTVVDNISVVRDGISNIYLIEDSLGYVMVDCGNSEEGVAAQLAVLGIAPGDVFAVLLTHSDGDHVGALGLFPHAEVYMAREEVQMIDGTTNRSLWFGNKLARAGVRLLDDRQTVQVGGLSVEGVLVPGHTAGMMAYLVNGEYLFSGDAVILKEGRIGEIPAFFDMNHGQAVASHAIIRNLPSARYIFTGHWGWGNYKPAVQ